MEVTVMPNPASVEKQQGLNQVVINKVQRMVEGKRQGVMETIARLLDEGKIAQDFIAPIGVNLRGKEKQPVISFRALDRVQMTMPEGNFSLHGNAISQISEKMGVPAKYLRELSGGDVWQKQLCPVNFLSQGNNIPALPQPEVIPQFFPEINLEGSLLFHPERRLVPHTVPALYDRVMPQSS